MTPTEPCLVAHGYTEKVLGTAETEVILVDQKWHRVIITGQSRSRKGTVGMANLKSNSRREKGPIRIKCPWRRLGPVQQSRYKKAVCELQLGAQSSQPIRRANSKCHFEKKKG